MLTQDRIDGDAPTWRNTTVAEQAFRKAREIPDRVAFYLEHEPDAQVTNLDLLTYAGVKATVDELDSSDRHSFVLGDIRDAALVDSLMPGHDVVVNFAAESHVDRSIDGPSVFLETNVVGTGVLIDAARRHNIGRFIQVSTNA